MNGGEFTIEPALVIIPRGWTLAPGGRFAIGVEAIRH
jgi:hypothetical protein